MTNVGAAPHGADSPTSRTATVLGRAARARSRRGPSSRPRRSAAAPDPPAVSTAAALGQAHGALRGRLGPLRVDAELPQHGQALALPVEGVRAFVQQEAVLLGRAGPPT